MLQKWVWLLIAVALFAAALGLFSEGLFSWTRATSPDATLGVEFQRFYRSGASGTMKLNVGSEAAGGRRTVLISNSILNAIVLDSIQPRPVAQAAMKDGALLTFEAPDPGSITITLVFRPRQAGIIRGSIFNPQSKAAVPVAFLVYP